MRLAKRCCPPNLICSSDVVIGRCGRRALGRKPFRSGATPKAFRWVRVLDIDERETSSVRSSRRRTRASRSTIRVSRSFAPLHSLTEAPVWYAAESSLDDSPVSWRTSSRLRLKRQVLGVDRLEWGVRPISCPHERQGLQVEGLREQFWRAPPLPLAHAP